MGEQYTRRRTAAGGRQLTLPSETIVVRSLVCHTAVPMALTALSSLARGSERPLQFVLHDDGSLRVDDGRRLREELGAQIVSKQEADDVAAPALARFRAAARYRDLSPLGLKLIDLPLMAGDELVYCDTDVFAFHPFSGLFEWPESASVMVFMSDFQNAYAVRPWHLVGRDALRLPVRVNTGLMLVRRSAYDLEFVDWVLSRELEVYRRIPGWVEQTCWAALGQRQGCRVYDPTQVRVIRSERCVSDPELVIGHFTSTVRSLWPGPRDAASWASPRREIKTWVPERLGIATLARDQLRRVASRLQRRTVS